MVGKGKVATTNGIREKRFKGGEQIPKRRGVVEEIDIYKKMEFQSVGGEVGCLVYGGNYFFVILQEDD